MIVSPDIKAIPTTYGGIKFRSRTEARWAVFFDALGVRWEYEHEGYQLPSGWYLPDFWLPEVNGGLFVEIKPERAPFPEEIDKCRELACFVERAVVLFHGSPDDFHTMAYNVGTDDYDGMKGIRGGGTIITASRQWDTTPDEREVSWMESSDDYPYFFCQCPNCGRIGLEWMGRSIRVCEGVIYGERKIECVSSDVCKVDFFSAMNSARTRRFW